MDSSIAPRTADSAVLAKVSGGGDTHQRRAGYLKQLAVLSGKNFKLKKILQLIMKKCQVQIIFMTMKYLN